MPLYATNRKSLYSIGYSVLRIQCNDDERPGSSPSGLPRRDDDWSASTAWSDGFRLRRACPGGTTTGRLALRGATAFVSVGLAVGRPVVAPPWQARRRRAVVKPRQSLITSVALVMQSSRHRRPG